jgi:hypothetical protein
MTSFWTKVAADVAQNQARCDSIQAEFRAETPARRSIRRDPPPIPPALIQTDDPLLLRLAEELEYARRMLEAMGETLSADGLLVARHLTALQSVDIVAQMIGHIADVVRSSDPAGAVVRIGMHNLKARLTRTKID